MFNASVLFFCFWPTFKSNLVDHIVLRVQSFRYLLLSSLWAYLQVILSDHTISRVQCSCGCLGPPSSQIYFENKVPRVQSFCCLLLSLLWAYLQVILSVRAVSLFHVFGGSVLFSCVCFGRTCKSIYHIVPPHVHCVCSCFSCHCLGPPPRQII